MKFLSRDFIRKISSFNNLNFILVNNNNNNNAVLIYQSVILTAQWSILKPAQDKYKKSLINTS